MVAHGVNAEKVGGLLESFDRSQRRHTVRVFRAWRSDDERGGDRYNGPVGWFERDRLQFLRKGQSLLPPHFVAECLLEQDGIETEWGNLLLGQEEDLDCQQGVIDFSLYLRNSNHIPGESPDDELENDNMTTVLDQKNYIEELNRHLK